MKTEIKIVALLPVLLLTSCTKTPSPAQENKIINTFIKELETSEALIKKVLTDTHSLLSKKISAPALHVFENSYTKDMIGVISNNKHTLRSNSYIAKGVHITPQIKQYLARTDYLEDYWQSTKSNETQRVSWQYTYHLASNTMRIYPWVDLSKMIGPSIQWSMVTFFKDMQRVHEYEGKNFCTRPYDDVGGTGLNISCCRVFNPENRFESIILTCADVSLRDALQNLRKLLAEEGQSQIRSILLSSNAPSIAYKSEALYDFRTGQTVYADHLREKLSKPKSISKLSLLNFEVVVDQAEDQR